MSITTYAELQTAAANWLDRTDLTARIPEFIAMGEAELNRRLRAPDMLTKDDAFSITGQYVALPTGIIEVVRFSISTSPVVNLEFVPPTVMAQMREGYTASGKPWAYSVVGGNFEFLPTPDATYTASILYYQRLDGLATTDPNWLLTAHPDIYLFATLVQAEPYLKNDERIMVWRGQLEKALEQLRVMNDRKRTGTTPARSRRLTFG